MALRFDPVKDAASVAKHGVSLARPADLENAVVVVDQRFTAEPRFRAYGLIHGDPYCLAFTIRDGDVRAIMLRRAHLKEYRRHAR